MDAPQTARTDAALAHTCQNVPGQTVNMDLDSLLVPRESESTGHSQTCRDELYALFGIWTKTIFPYEYASKEYFEQEDKKLREEARSLYIQQLAMRRVLALHYISAVPNNSNVTVFWDNNSSSHYIKGRSTRHAARTAFLYLVRQQIRKFLTHVPVWPINRRPLQMDSVSLKSSVSAVSNVDWEPLRSLYANAPVQAFTAKQGPLLLCNSEANTEHEHTQKTLSPFKAPLTDFTAFNIYAQRQAPSALDTETLHGLYSLFRFIRKMPAESIKVHVDENDPQNNCFIGFSRMAVNVADFSTRMASFAIESSFLSWNIPRQYKPRRTMPDQLLLCIGLFVSQDSTEHTHIYVYNKNHFHDEGASTATKKTETTLNKDGAVLEPPAGATAAPMPNAFYGDEHVAISCLMSLRFKDGADGSTAKSVQEEPHTACKPNDADIFSVIVPDMVSNTIKEAIRYDKCASFGGAIYSEPRGQTLTRVCNWFLWYLASLFFLFNILGLKIGRL